MSWPVGKLHSPEAIVKMRAAKLCGIGLRAGMEDAYLLARQAGFDRKESVRIANFSFREASK